MFVLSVPSPSPPTFSYSVCNPLPFLLPGERVAGVPVVLLRKEAVYNAVGVAAYELHDYVDWDPWLRGALLQVRGGRQGGAGGAGPCCLKSTLPFRRCVPHRSVGAPPPSGDE